LLHRRSFHFYFVLVFGVSFCLFVTLRSNHLTSLEKKKILKDLVGEFDAKIETVEKEKLRRRLLRAENERREREGGGNLLDGQRGVGLGEDEDGEVTGEFTGSMSTNIQERTSDLISSLKNGEYGYCIRLD
jgi:hypothetical protein